jgi:hypothetical protein
MLKTIFQSGSFAILALIATLSLPVFAQTTYNYASIPSPSAKFGLNFTSCLKVVDWDTRIADIKAGRPNTNPNLDLGCVKQNNVVVDENGNNQLDTGDVKVANYSDFSIGQANTKQRFAGIPVLGVFPNGNFPAQYTGQGGTSVNRGVASGLSSIFTPAQLNLLYNNGQINGGAPRMFSTGPDCNTGQQTCPDPYGGAASNNQGYNSSTNPPVYQGGWCEETGGQIKVRSQRVGVAITGVFPSERDPSNPTQACARTVNGTREASVAEQNYEVYQFVRIIPYPNATQCTGLGFTDQAACKTAFQNFYGQSLAGNANNNDNNNAVVTVRTFFGAFDKKYTRWVGWVNTDVNGPRASSSDGTIRNFDGLSIYELAL